MGLQCQVWLELEARKMVGAWMEPHSKKRSERRVSYNNNCGILDGTITITQESTFPTPCSKTRGHLQLYEFSKS